MQISGRLLLAGAVAAIALPVYEDQPGKKPGWSYEVYYWNISNLQASELDGEKSPRFHYLFNISAPVYNPPSVYAAPSIPSFAGTCEGASTAQLQDQSVWVDCTTNRKVGETSDGGIFGGLSALLKPNSNHLRPDIAISFQWTQEISNKKYNITAFASPTWAIDQPKPTKLDILEPDMLWERWV
ncbi:hypothetical protein PGQ11_000444 [Apiospora arundinis]